MNSQLLGVNENCKIMQKTKQQEERNVYLQYLLYIFYLKK